MWWDPGYPATTPVQFIGPLRLKKKSTEKKIPWEKMPKGDRFESLRTLRYRSWRISIPWRNVWRQRKSGAYRVRFVAFPSVEFPKICWTVKHICALPDDWWVKKFKKTKFEIEEENTTLQKREETPFIAPIFSAFKWLAGQVSQIVKILRDFTEANRRKLEAKPNYYLRVPPLVEP